MNYSKYQVGVFDKAQHSTRNIAVNAVAGSGKSFTLEKTVELFSGDVTILCVAFNRDIVNALAPRIKHPRAKVQTLNGFGAGICYRQIRGLGDIDKFKTGTLMRDFFDMGDGRERNWYYKMRDPVSRLVELFRANLIFPNDLNENKIRETAGEYGVELPSEKPTFFELVANVYAKCLTLKNYPDFRDQVFMPIYLDLEIPKFDVLLVDESQDLDPNQMELVIRAGRRIFMFGDPHQGIYGFRGAMSNAMQHMIQRINAEELPLSVCYRCPKAVIRRAQKIVPQIEWCDDAPEGLEKTITADEYRKIIEPGNFVLCRCTAPLVSECLRMIRADRKAMVKGREIGQHIMTLVQKVWTGPTQRIEDFYLALSSYLTQQISRLTELGREDDILEVQDRVETIRVLLESCTSEYVGEIEQVVARIFADDVAGIIYMTIHKAKGLESTRVVILEPQLLPHPAAKKPWQKEQEKNLEYVGITRCKFERGGSDGELYWVTLPKPGQEEKTKAEQPKAQPKAEPKAEPKAKDPFGALDIVTVGS